MQSTLRIALVTIGILFVPFLAMHLTDQVHWTIRDFGIAGALLLGTGLIYEFLVRKLPQRSHRSILGLVLLCALTLVWADLAVGIFNIPGFSGS